MLLESALLSEAKSPLYRKGVWGIGNTICHKKATAMNAFGECTPERSEKPPLQKGGLGDR